MGLNLADEMVVDSFTVGIVPSLPDCEDHGHFGWSAGPVADGEARSFHSVDSNDRNCPPADHVLVRTMCDWVGMNTTSNTSDLPQQKFPPRLFNDASSFSVLVAKEAILIFWEVEDKPTATTRY